MGFALLILVFMGCASCGHPATGADAVDTAHLEKDLLHLETKIPLAAVSGRIDHMAYDPAGHRLFVAALGNRTVEVVDLAAGTRLHSITGLREPQGVAYLPALERLVVADGGTGGCMLYDGHSYAVLGRVALGDDADNVRSDSQKIYVGYGSGGIAVIDPAQMRKIGDLTLEGHPESFQLGDSGRVWVNVPDAGEIVVGDLATLNLRSEWRNHDASANFPMALDRQHSQLVVAYRHPAQLRILDSRTGTVEASVGCVGDADDVFYDAATGLVFVSGGDGYLDVFRGPTRVNHLPTQKGARTSLWLPAERKLVLAVPARAGKPAALWIYGIT